MVFGNTEMLELHHASVLFTALQVEDSTKTQGPKKRRPGERFHGPSILAMPNGA